MKNFDLIAMLLLLLLVSIPLKSDDLSRVEETSDIEDYKYYYDMPEFFENLENIHKDGREISLSGMIFTEVKLSILGNPFGSVSGEVNSILIDEYYRNIMVEHNLCYVTIGAKLKKKHDKFYLSDISYVRRSNVLYFSAISALREKQYKLEGKIDRKPRCVGEVLVDLMSDVEKKQRGADPN